jgi:hypothetical protein
MGVSEKAADTTWVIVERSGFAVTVRVQDEVLRWWLARDPQGNVLDDALRAAFVGLDYTVQTETPSVG